MHLWNHFSVIMQHFPAHGSIQMFCLPECSNIVSGCHQVADETEMTNHPERSCCESGSVDNSNYGVAQSIIIRHVNVDQWVYEHQLQLKNWLLPRSNSKKLGENATLANT